MPYISTEKVAQIRAEIKKALPDYKFSIRRVHGSTADISIVSGPIDFGTEYAQINHYYIKDHYEGEAARVLSVIKQIASTGVYVEVEDGDYGSVPSHYVHISIGAWDKPYKQLQTA